MSTKADKSEQKSMQLTMRLIRKGIKHEKALVKGHKLTEKKVVGIDNAKFFIGTAFRNPPDWTSFLKDNVEDMPDETELSNQGVAAILMVPIPETDRLMALCFGYAHIWLDLDKCERNFGLKVTLNKVDANQLKGLELAALDAVTFSKKLSASKASHLQDFNVDYNRELALTASGKLDKGDNFATSLAGNDSLKINCKVSFEKLPSKCKEIYDAFNLDDYKNNGFDWVDHIQRVKEHDLVFKLDKKIYQAINQMIKGRNKDLHLFIPEVPEDDLVSSFTLSGLNIKSQKNQFNELEVKHYIDLLKHKGLTITITEDEIEKVKKGHRLQLKFDSGNKKSYKLYDCIVFETSFNKEMYIIFRGQWYKIEKEFAKIVNDYFMQFTECDSFPKTTASKNEQKLLNAWKRKANLLLLDKQKINPKGAGRASIEPCDFFSDKKEFIHLKDGHASSTISHLWNQGLVSANGFINDETFRDKLRQCVSSQGGTAFLPLLPDKGDTVVSSEYTVVYGIMRKPYKNGSLGIPFFSKVSFRSVATQLKNMGFQVKVNLIKKTGSPKSSASKKPKTAKKKSA